MTHHDRHPSRPPATVAELHFIGEKRRWTQTEVQEVQHCLRVNANLVRRLDELKQLAYVAHCSGDFEWVQEICAKIDEIEATTM